MSNDRFQAAWWLPGRHAQTFGARFLRSHRNASITCRRERLELPDGDFLDLDWVRNAVEPEPTGAAPLVMLLHGLEGSAQSGYALELYRALARLGVAAVGMNFRGCSGEPNRLRRSYHSGETGDLGFVVAQLAQRFPERRLGACGVSLGGNVLLKYLGERGGATVAESSPLRAAVAISVPYDLSAGADYVERGLSRLSRSYLMRKLKRKVRAKRHLFDGQIDVDRVRRTRTFREFDALVTAPVHGFADAEDYYQQSSSAQFLAHVRIPTLLIHALDDPFLPVDRLPVEAARANPHLRIAFHERGGHVGFVAGPPWAPVFWAEKTAAAFLAEQLWTQ